MGFGQGLSGLDAASQDLDVIGNNIANVGTAGFKSATISFADVYASSRVGLGVNVAAITQDFGVGNLSAGGQYDVAIDGTNGLFRLTDTSGSIYYSRNGQFLVDKDFYLVNNQGYRLTGYAPNAIGAAPIELQLPQGNIAPQATTNLGTQTNLNADAPPIVGNFDHQVRATYTDSVPTTVHDSLGNPHQLVQYFVKRAAQGNNSIYDVYYRLDGQFSQGGDQEHVTLTFDNAGRLTNVNPNNPALNFAVAAGGGASPAQNLVVAMDYSTVTQFGSKFNPKVTVNGYTSGELAGVTFSKDGEIVGRYTNGQTKTIGVLALAHFNNVQGLQPIGNNNWIQTGDSGPAILGQPGTGGLATVVGQKYEESNVDMNKELVKLIIAQRDYQANAKSIEAQNNIMQSLLTRL